MEPQEQVRVLRRLRENDTLKDIRDHLTIERIRDIFKYAPTMKLAWQIRETLVRLLERTELPEQPTRVRRLKRREVNPPEV
jgi:hypothetical protein